MKMKGKYGEIVRSDRTFDVMQFWLYYHCDCHGSADLCGGGLLPIGPGLYQGEVLLWPRLTAYTPWCLKIRKDIWRISPYLLFYSTWNHNQCDAAGRFAAYPLSGKLKSEFLS